LADEMLLLHRVVTTAPVQRYVPSLRRCSVASASALPLASIVKVTAVTAAHNYYLPVRSVLVVCCTSVSSHSWTCAI
jgi:hypothetical protein